MGWRARDWEGRKGALKERGRKECVCLCVREKDGELFEVKLNRDKVQRLKGGKRPQYLVSVEYIFSSTCKCISMHAVCLGIEHRHVQH